MNVNEAAQAVAQALKTVPKLRVYTDLAATVDPPAAMLGPPSLTWGSYAGGPTKARFIVYVIVSNDDRAMETLWELMPQVVAALEASRDADITLRPGEDQATPGRWPTESADLPAYEILTEVAL